MADSQVLNKDTDLKEDEQKQEERLNELYEKKELSDDEKKEIDILKSSRKDRYQKRLDKMKSNELAAKHEAELAKQRAEDAEKRIKALEEEKKVKIGRVIEETIEIDGKHYPTDRALKSMIEAGELTDEEAWGRKEERDKEEISFKTVQKLRNENKQNEVRSIREADLAGVLKQYPRFDKNHPDHDPSDPLFKETLRLLANGYSVNPRGISEAVKDAKRILRVADDNPDITDDISLRSSNPPRERGKDTEIQLTDHEKEYAAKLYQNTINPKTGKTYTPEEAVAKHKKAKERQMASRRS